MASYQKIAVLDNEIQAQRLAAILDEKKIPYSLNSYHSMAYDGLFQLASGWGHVEAPSAYRNEIKNIINNLERGLSVFDGTSETGLE